MDEIDAHRLRVDYGLEHIVPGLAPGGAEHPAILDGFDGVDADQSTITTQLGAISGQVADASSTPATRRRRPAAEDHGGRIEPRPLAATAETAATSSRPRREHPAGLTLDLRKR